MSDKQPPVSPSNSPLGKTGLNPDQFTADWLYPIPRQQNRSQLQYPLVDQRWYGEDHWQAWELSWLDPQGKPQQATADISVACDTKNIIESKSLKLYLQSCNMQVFESREQLLSTLQADLTKAADGEVNISLFAPEQWPQTTMAPSGQCIDDQPLTTNRYQRQADLLRCQQAAGEELLYSHLLRTLCPVTGQPDWATLVIDYQGVLIDHQALLAYLISYRQYQDFHEHCVEQIFCDIWHHCQPRRLLVQARYLRRGGLDINPLRSSSPDWCRWQRGWRQ